MKVISSMLLIFGLAAQCSAIPGVGIWNCVGTVRAFMGTSPDALDSRDGWDVPSVLSPDSVVLGSYQVNGVDGWDGNTGFYGIDMRAPLAPGQSKTWLLYLWATEGTTASDIGVAAHLDVDADSSLQSRLELVQKPAGLAGGPAVGTVWTTSHTGDIYLPRYKTSNGLNGYGFNLTLTMVPEPSSILALAGGIAGLGGLSLRRRRK